MSFLATTASINKFPHQPTKSEEIIAITGLNGSGKACLASWILRQNAPDQQQILCPHISASKEPLFRVSLSGLTLHTMSST
jgi:ABC-type cobalamin/Fe3+-siderophores transport system ATPase subunit